MLMMLDGERPYLVLSVRPRVYCQANQIIHGRFMGLIHENSGYKDNGDYGKPESNTTVKAGACYAFQRPF